MVGDRRNGSNSGAITQYLDLLCQEVRLSPPTGLALETVFFGGGTPSLLTAPQIDRLLTLLDRQFGIADTAEISMEIDPGTFDLAQVQGYRTAGVNRVSLGVQAFQPDLLAACGRSHTVEQVYSAVAQIRQAGFENFSLDLISGLPHQTLADWQASLDQAIALAPTHLSCYDLTVEPMTPFGRQEKSGRLSLPSDDATADMYRTAQRCLTAAGYQHYEISNYAQPGWQCRHNRTYWENRPFYGFGMGATSYVGGDRVARPRKTREYADWVLAQASGNQPQVAAATPHPAAAGRFETELFLDTLMLGLRLAEGLDIAALRQQFGSQAVNQVWQCLQPYLQTGWVEAVAEVPTLSLPATGRIRFSDPEGFLFSNVMLVRLFEAFE